jgi:hypothetical protein
LEQRQLRVNSAQFPSKPLSVKLFMWNLLAACDTKNNRSGAQTKRWGDAWPVR